MDAKQVHVWFGHHSPAFTLAAYVHLLRDDLPNPNFLDAAVCPSGEPPDQCASAAASRR